MLGRRKIDYRTGCILTPGRHIWRHNSRFQRIVLRMRAGLLTPTHGHAPIASACSPLQRHLSIMQDGFMIMLIDVYPSSIKLLCSLNGGTANM